MGQRRGRRALAALGGLALFCWLAGAALAASPPASPAEPRDLAEEQLATLDTRELQRVLDELNRELVGYAPALTVREVLGLYRGRDGNWQPMALAGGLFRYLFHEVWLNGALLARLVVLAVISALLQSLQAAFERETTGRLAYAVVYLVLVALALGGFAVAVDTARGVIDRLVSFMLALLPTLLTLLAAMGGAVSAGIFHPLMVAATHLVSQTVVAVVFPLLFFAAVLDLVGNFNGEFRLSGLAGLFRQAGLTVLGLTFTVFLGVMAVKGAAGAVADGVALRTGKYLAATFIPVVGKMFADAAELIIGSSLLLKNALGLLGAGAIFLIVAFPLLKIASLVLVYRLSAAMIQPVGGAPVAACLNTMASTLSLVFVAVATVALMFFVAVTVLVAAANFQVMLR